MPSLVLKGSHGGSTYCLWSSVVDAPTIVAGGRDEMIAELVAWEYPQYKEDYARQEAAGRLDRADINGTSAMYPRLGPDADGGWNDESLVYRSNTRCGSLPRARLDEFLRGYLETGEFPEEMVEPWEELDLRAMPLDEEEEA